MTVLNLMLFGLQHLLTIHSQFSGSILLMSFTSALTNNLVASLDEVQKPIKPDSQELSEGSSNVNVPPPSLLI